MGLEKVSLFEGFSKLSRKQRFERLMELGYIDKEDIKLLKLSSFIQPDLAEKFIENSLGYFPMPFGVATNFNIDGNELPIPMVVEETSIIAAASKTAKWVKSAGGIRTSMLGHLGIGQIQFAKLQNPKFFETAILGQFDEIIKMANQVPALGLVKRGGGVKNLKVRILERPDGHKMGVVHVEVKTCDAMGANIINQICEFLSEPLEQITKEKVTMCILSNLTDTRLVKAEVELFGIDPVLGEKIKEASLFSVLDPYRAATNNKGVMNGIDPILIATGNDWRAVQAGVHAYAASSGQYRSITNWDYDVKSKKLFGHFIAPISVGTVGGVTALHPFAKMSIKMLGIKSADDLSRICGAVGLVQNLGALRALSTVGIIEGHMKLHIKNLALSAGAEEFETIAVQSRLEEILKATRRISLSNAIDVLSDLRRRAPVEDSNSK